MLLDVDLRIEVAVFFADEEGFVEVVSDRLLEEVEEL